MAGIFGSSGFDRAREMELDRYLDRLDRPMCEVCGEDLTLYDDDWTDTELICPECEKRRALRE